MNDININLIIKALEENPNAKIKIEIIKENRTDQWSKLNEVRHKWFKECSAKTAGHWFYGGKMAEVLGRDNCCRRVENAWNSIRTLALYMCGETSIETMKHPGKVAEVIDELAELLFTRAKAAMDDNT